MTEAQWRTHRLELADQTLREWDAVVLDSAPEGIVLDRSAFYPGGGGQPPDEGVLLWGGVQTRIAGAVQAIGLVNIFAVVAFVAAAIYLVDVRPKVRTLKPGSRQGPYGPW